MTEQNILTTKECEELISQKLQKDFKLIDMTIKPISDDVHGYMGQHLRVKCDVNVSGEMKTIQFFIKKKLDEVDFNAQAHMNEAMNMFENEAVILKFLNDRNENATWLPLMVKYRPPNVIVFEDLAERGYELAKIEYGKYDVEHCKCVLTALAQLHGFSLSYDRKNDVRIVDEMDIFNDLLNTRMGDMGAKWIKSGIDSTIYMINQTPKPESIKQSAIENFVNYIDEYCQGMQPNQSKFQALSHGDLWTNNLMFKYNNDTPLDCCLIDFQLMRYIPFTQDVLFALYVNTRAEFRNTHLQELLEFYYETLGTILLKYGMDVEELITRDEYFELCEERKRSALIMSHWYKEFLYMDRGYFNEKMMDNAAGMDIMFGDRIQFIKPQLEKNDSYKEIIFEEIDELINTFA